MPVRERSRRGLSRFMHRGSSTKKERTKPSEDVRASLRLIEDIFHLDEGQENVVSFDDALDEESLSLSSEHTEPRDNRTNSKLNLGLSRSDLSRGWNRSPDSYKEMAMTHMSSPFLTTRTSPRSSPLVRSTSSSNMGPSGGLSRQGSRRHLHGSCVDETPPDVPISSPPRGSPPKSLPSRRSILHRMDSSLSPPPPPQTTSMPSRRSIIDRTDSSSSPPTKMQSRRSTINRTESPSSDKDSLKPPRTHGTAVPSVEDGTHQHPPRGDRSPNDGSPQPPPPMGGAVGQEGSMVTTGRPMSRRMTAEPLKPRFREFPMKCPSQPMLSVPERETLPGVWNATLANAIAPEPTPYLPGFSEGDYVDDERLERILHLIQQQKKELTNQETRSSASCHLSPSKASPLPTNSLSLGTDSKVPTCQPTFDVKDSVDDDQFDVVLQNLQDRDVMKKPWSFHEQRGTSWQYPNYCHPSQVNVVPHLSLNQKQGQVMSPLRLTFTKQESLPTIRREVHRTYSLPSISSIVRV